MRIFLAAAMTVELMPFPMSEKLVTDADFLEKFYKNPRAEKALALVIPWLDRCDALKLPN